MRSRSVNGRRPLVPLGRRGRGRSARGHRVRRLQGGAQLQQPASPTNEKKTTENAAKISGGSSELLRAMNLRKVWQLLDKPSSNDDELIKSLLSIGTNKNKDGGDRHMRVRN